MAGLARHARSFVGLILLASCSSLIGLEDLTPDDDEGETGGRLLGSAKGGSKSDGGQAGVGEAGTSPQGEAGHPDGAKGGTSGRGGGNGGGGAAGGGKGGKGGGGPSSSNGGSSAGDAGKGGTGGKGGIGGAGGTAGDGGTGGDTLPSNCQEITAAYFSANNDLDEGNAAFEFTVSPDIGGPGLGYLLVEFYWFSGLNGKQTGTFVIDGSDDAQFASCARCVRIQDQSLRFYLAVSGVVSVDPASQHYYGHPRVLLSDLTFVEVTIEGDDAPIPYLSTPVPNGACFHLTSLMLDKPPKGWDCDDDPTGGTDLAYYLDGMCDCGCGVLDGDCASTSPAECDFIACASKKVEPSDNTQCLEH